MTAGMHTGISKGSVSALGSETNKQYYLDSKWVLFMVHKLCAIKKEEHPDSLIIIQRLQKLIETHQKDMKILILKFTSIFTP